MKKKLYVYCNFEVKIKLFFMFKLVGWLIGSFGIFFKINEKTYKY